MLRCADAGPSVATILVRRCRLIGFGFWAAPAPCAAGVAGTGAARPPAGGLALSGLPARNGFCGGCSLEFGELHGPGALLAGIHLEKAGAVEAAGQAVANAADGELLVAGAHVGLSHPFAAAIVVDGVHIVITRDKITLEHGLAAA